MSGSNAGTGQPITLKCGRCRLRRRSWRSAGEPGELVRTGRTRPYKTHKPGPRMTRTAHEYRCLTCGHVGWSAHVDAARKPLAAA